MDKNGKINAFALQEMMVVLLITVIVVGMAFSVLNLVQRQMGSIKAIYEVKLEADRLRQSLWSDFNRYENIRYDPETEYLYLSNELGTKYYGVTENSVVTERDTFHVAVRTKKFFFNNKTITSGALDALEIRTSKASGHQQIFVYKDNTAATFMNQ